MKEYLYNHNYISDNKKSNYQQELSIERAECIINKHNSLIQEEKQQLISFLKNKIKNYEELEKYLYKKENTKLVEKTKIIGCICAYKEVLDFVNKGGKE